MRTNPEQTFVERVQEMARERFPFSLNTMGVLQERDVDTLTETIIKNTLEEVGRVVEKQRQFRSKEIGERGTKYNSKLAQHNTTLDHIQSLLAEMVRPLTHTGDNN